MYVVAILTAACIGFYLRSSGTHAQLWLEMAIGCIALLAATVILRVVRAPPVAWPLGRAKFALTVIAIALLAPVLGGVALIAAFSALPALLFVPFLFWHEDQEPSEERSPGAHSQELRRA